ncbi:MAG TPA: flagellar biosynthesis protein FlhB [Limnochorda sp.]
MAARRLGKNRKSPNGNERSRQDSRLEPAGQVTFRFDLQRFAEERTVPPSPRRLREARERGEVAKSQELGPALLLLMLGLFVGLVGPFAARGPATLAVQLFQEPPPAGAWTREWLGGLMAQAALAFIQAAGPFLVVALVVGVGSQVAQIGLLFTTKPLEPKLERINPVAGFQRIFSRRSLFELAKSVLKVAVVGSVAYWVLSGTILELVGLIHATPVLALEQVGRALSRLLWTTAGVWLVIAAADYAFQRSQYLNRLRMTPYEFKQELRETEGDPHVRQRIRQQQRKIAGRRMIQAVRTADVVITNPTHVAVALKYEMHKMNAPVVVAKGADYLARRIREEALAHGVRVVENPPLARALYEACDVDQEIPERLYRAVAEVLALVWRLNRGR